MNGDGYVDLVALTHDGVAASTVFVYPGGPAGVSATPAAEVSSRSRPTS